MDTQSNSDNVFQPGSRITLSGGSVGNCEVNKDLWYTGKHSNHPLKKSLKFLSSNLQHQGNCCAPPIASLFLCSRRYGFLGIRKVIFVVTAWKNSWKTLTYTYKFTCCFVEFANLFSVNKGIWIQGLCEQISEVNVSIEVEGSNGG
jgi:hypothetical protein